jgi:hypothetical protein
VEAACLAGIAAITQGGGLHAPTVEILLAGAGTAMAPEEVAAVESLVAAHGVSPPPQTAPPAEKQPKQQRQPKQKRHRPARDIRSGRNLNGCILNPRIQTPGSQLRGLATALPRSQLYCFSKSCEAFQATPSNHKQSVKKKPITSQGMADCLCT